MRPPTFSVGVLHTSWHAERIAALDMMLKDLQDSKTRASRVLLSIFDERRPPDVSWAEFKTRIAARQWATALDTGASHHIFLTDDLRICPWFWPALHAMVSARPKTPIGLLSNHPRGPSLFAGGVHGYRTNSWIVGPAYVVPHEKLSRFLGWYLALPDTEDPKGRRWFNDDSALNEWITYFGGGETWHPLPTIIEHRADIDSTVGHGDRFSRERLSWRELRGIREKRETGDWEWETIRGEFASPAEMGDRRFWAGDAPMLPVGDS
jgi:hypothetical protein